ncbi:MAG: hypothetical protein LBJ02_06115 [Bifidobacteriaceae bacterium]|nr:hypothetical protein [Bifidobacteriaceae bacterium]
MLGVLIGFVAVLVCPAGLEDAPLRDGVSVLVIQLCPLLGPALATSCFASPGRRLERLVAARRGPNPVALRRAMWGASLSVGLVAGPVAAGLLRNFPLDLTAALGRNAVFGIGLALLSAALLAPAGSWCPVVATGLVTWVFGGQDSFGSVVSWAFLLKPWEDWPWTVVAALILLVGLTVYVLFDGREA